MGKLPAGSPRTLGHLEDRVCHLHLSRLRLFSASGDVRPNGDTYLYEIQLSSLSSPTHPGCSGASVCQVKPNDQRFSRKVGTSENTRYYVQGNYFLVLLIWANRFLVRLCSG